MKQYPRVDILMATYHGEKYVDKQIESILNQNYPNIHLRIRDDGSSDDTAKILQRKAEQFPNQITLLPASTQLGVVGNFSALMLAARAHYVMLADQDDVWLPDKIEKTWEKMAEMEEQYGRETPLLVHTDLKVVDADLHPIHRSFWHYSHLKPAREHTLPRLLMQNVITGCTVMVNRPLLAFALPVPIQAIMHDWWLGLVAVALGRIDIVPEATLLYRQHAHNQVGCKKGSVLSGWKRLHAAPQQVARMRERKAGQAAALLARHRDRLTAAQRRILQTFSQIHQCSTLQRITSMARFGFYKNGFWRNLLEMIPNHLLKG